ncbi:MAG: acyl-ACP thioesterase [uncultured bacterium]|nr:MAG: acyl-ACP thioesterase [uncultured bacterium]HBY02220.1 hypothetical protein [Rikenellaceae bacterium]
MKVLREQFRIKSYETDIHACMKPYSFMLNAQEMANRHADYLGFGYRDLEAKGIMWVLSRVKVVFNRIPEWNEEVIMETWHKGTVKLFGIRDFKMDSVTGESLAVVTSSWLILNNETRRIQRIDQYLAADDPSINRINAIETPAAKLVPPGNMKYAKKHRVEFSDIDINAHTNNAKYLEWAFDCIDQKVLATMKVKEFEINFNSESRIGEEIDLFINDSRNKVFVEGKRGETTVFQTEVTYNKI